MEMVAVQEQLTMIEEELMESKEDFKRTKSELNRILAWADEVNKITDMFEEDLANTKDELRLKTIETKEMNIMDYPRAFACGANMDPLPINSQTIPYTTLLDSHTNANGSGLDISNGMFTLDLTPQLGAFLL